MDTARPGVPAGTWRGRRRRRSSRSRDRTFFHDLYGYSVGIGFPPSWYETLGFELRVDNERPLEVGMAFHVPISLRRYAEFGVCQSQTIIITADGAESLSQAPAALRVLAG